MTPDFEGRKVAFKALVGSHNYNLNDETSDKDYKYFVFPNFDDLYDNKYYALPSQVTEELDYDVHDVRKIPQLFYKANINFVEVLYSKEVETANNEFLFELYGMRDKLSKMNLPYFYHACKGMHFNKMDYLYKGTKGTRHLVKQFGYDTKQALHAYRVLDFPERLVYTDFSFLDAMKYNTNEREFMLAIKTGAFSELEFKTLIDEKLKKFLTLKEVYDKIVPDDETYGKLKSLVRGAVYMEFR